VLYVSVAIGPRSPFPEMTHPDQLGLFLVYELSIPFISANTNSGDARFSSLSIEYLKSLNFSYYAVVRPEPTGARRSCVKPNHIVHALCP
jgi:hypothetical protein